jgi:hypothetical protein
MSRTSAISVHTLGTGSLTEDGSNCTFIQKKNSTTTTTATSTATTATTATINTSTTTTRTMWSYFGRKTTVDTATSTSDASTTPPVQVIDSMNQTLRKDSTVTTATAEEEMEDSERSSNSNNKTDSPSNSNCDSNNKAVCYNTQTDRSYHSDIEKEGCDRMRDALTQDEIQELADEYMPLRHFRAEKVRTLCVCACVCHYDADDGADDDVVKPF